PLLSREGSLWMFGDSLAYAHLGRADLLAEKGLHDKAIADYSNWLALQEKMYDRNVKSERPGFGTPEPKGNHDVFRRVHVPSLFRYGMALLRCEQEEKAEAIFKKAVSWEEAGAKQSPLGGSGVSYGRGMFDAGVVYMGAKKWERAAEWFE